MFTRTCIYFKEILSLISTLHATSKLYRRIRLEELLSDIELRDWTQREELLYRRSVLYIPEVEAVLYIPEVEALRMEILKKHHDDLIAGHLAIKKTYNTLRHKYFRPNMYQQVDAYCTSCLICQGARVIRGKQPGQLQPPPISTKAWDVFSMDESVAYWGR